jgi:hypothetical protein
MPPTFFLKVKQNCTTPFWLHPTLNTTLTSQPLNECVPKNRGSSEDDDNKSENDDDNGLVDTGAGISATDCSTLHEWAVENIQMLWDFCNGLEYQLQFEDHRMFETMEWEGATFMQFAHNCLSCEH